MEKLLTTDGKTMGGGHKAVTIAHLEHLVLR